MYRREGIYMRYLPALKNSVRYVEEELVMGEREGGEFSTLDIEKSYEILWPQWKRQLNGKALRGVRPP